MKLKFNLKFATTYGQTIFIVGNIPVLGSFDYSKAAPLNYKDATTWELEIEVDNLDILHYQYILRTTGEADILQATKNEIRIGNKKIQEIFTKDEWNSPANFNNAFLTQPFTKVFSKNTISKAKKNITYTHAFSVHATMLQANECICLVGSGVTLNNWKTDKPHLLQYENGVWQAFITLQEEPISIAYKYGIYNAKLKAFISFENGDNRIVTSNRNISHPIVVHDSFVNVNTVQWKGAGVAIPVFSLRSKTSFGSGEFTDIKLLADWALQAGLKVIQLLPVNDTIATHTNRDSYPYAAISAFALHPLYISLQQIAGKEYANVIKALDKKKLQLNKQPFVDYENVMKFKLLALKELFALQKESFYADVDFKKYFSVNKHWLLPYAVFCYLRDKYNTADSSLWKGNSVYSAAAIKQLASPSQKHYDEIAIHYFTQYHLHLQLKEATEYAHKKGIAIKGDLPIGVYRYSADVWVEPDEFIMSEQAGAPPDDFAVKGQNWGFPTYNWKKMQEDGFAWWQKRFEQMGHYFDAFRIDHILGFFRIWSIPLHAVEGIMGRFVPAISVHINEFFQRNIAYSYQRFCKPFVNDDLINILFGEQADFVKNTFFENGILKKEFDTQRKVEAYCLQHPEQTHLQQGLFDVISNVILFDDGNGQQFHFRYGATSTHSFKNLDAHSQQQLNELYLNYFYQRQDDFWKAEALKKLPGLKGATNMLVCGEDLGMVPDCVPGVMQSLGILSLEIQRMPKAIGVEFMHPNDVPYSSVITPSTHDMSTLRGWWEEDKTKTQFFYNNLLNRGGEAPAICSGDINATILLQHLYSPAMLCIFQLQDILGIDEKLRRENPHEERINVPADPNNFWKYRMHISLEDLIKEKDFNAALKSTVQASGR